jgi:UDP-glucuronate decarboxylase
MRDEVLVNTTRHGYRLLVMSDGLLCREAAGGLADFNVADVVAVRFPSCFAAGARYPNGINLHVITKEFRVRTLITGGAGFIGSHLCERFLAEGHEVVAVDNIITGDLANLDHLRTNPRFRFIGHDVSNPLKVKDKLDNVLHFASPASPVDYLEHPIPTLKVGALGTHNTLGLAKAHGARYLLASTSEVYGDPLEHPQKETYWGNVNPIGIRGCFSSDTEVLTRAGWKTFLEVTTDDGILTRRPDGMMEYHKPTEVIRQRYIGELIGFKNSKIDLLVTPNHKMLVRVRDESEFRLVEAYQAIRWERAEMAKSGRWEGEERAEFRLPLVSNAKMPQREMIPMDLWLEFLGYFLSEGCTYLQNKTREIGRKTYPGHAHLVFISQSKKKPANREKIRRCLQKLGFRFHEEKAQFRIHSKQLWTYLRQFGKARDKFVPRDLLQLSPRQLRILFDALMLGDGSADGRKFYSSSPALIGAVQEILLKLGLAGTVYAKSPDRPVWAIHVLNESPRDFLTPHYPKRHVEPYDGEVHCVTVPNHVIYVRRNGKAVWCGNCYDEAKRFAESIVMAYHRVHKVDTKIIRIFNTYGERMRLNDGRVLPNFMYQALMGQPLTVYGDGKQTRSFQYVSDLVEGIWRLLHTDFHDPVNLGNPAEITILEFAQEILRLSGSASQIEYRPLPQDDPKVRQPDITRARQLLGWEPVVGREEGLKRTLEFFKRKLGK